MKILRSSFLFAALAIITFCATKASVGENVIQNMKQSLKQPSIELLASSELVDWDTFENRIKALKDALIAFENKLGEFKQAKNVLPAAIATPTSPTPAPTITQTPAITPSTTPEVTPV
ncbi:MAG: hypothetical protein US22_C0003G0025, partial [candidate division TM6 bacterium GW2011_GWF2_36_6]